MNQSVNDGASNGTTSCNLDALKIDESLAAYLCLCYARLHCETVLPPPIPVLPVPQMLEQPARTVTAPQVSSAPSSTGSVAVSQSHSQPQHAAPNSKTKFSGSGQDKLQATNVNIVKPSVANVAPPFQTRSCVYRMTHKRRGLCLIVANQKFEPQTRMPDRVGAHVDVENLQKTFAALQFEILILQDLTCTDMQRVFQQIARQDHSNADCFACCILSHGEQGDLLYGRDGTVHIPDLLAPFKGDVCRSLAGKPKLFFIQACRGTKLDHGVCITEEPDDVTDSAPARGMRIPSEADFLLAYSAVPGHYSWRNAARGSWFVQALVEVFTNFADKMDVLSMMTLVNSKVAYDFESQIDDPNMKHKKQIPCIVSMLTKQVWFVSKLPGKRNIL